MAALPTAVHNNTRSQPTLLNKAATTALNYYETQFVTRVQNKLIPTPPFFLIACPFKVNKIVVQSGLLCALSFRDNKICAAIFVSMKKRLRFWLLLYTIGAWFSTGFHHFDEHFQIIEFAQYKLGFNTADDLTWEFHERMRPALQPAMAYLGLKSMSAAGLTDPFLQMFLFRWLTALLSLGAAFLFYQKFENKLSSETHKNWFWLLNVGLWMLVFSRLRFSSEAWSALAMLVGLVLVVDEKKHPRLLLGGFLLGLAFVFRFQAGAFVFGLGAWMLFIQKSNGKALGMAFSGIMLALLLGVVLDRWFYEAWVFTPWNYLDLNILQDRVSGFGVSPWYQYFVDLLAYGLPPFSLILLLFGLLYPILFPKSPVAWSVMPFVLLHIAVGHKEARFLFPALAFLPWMVIAVADKLPQRFSWTKGFTKPIWVRLFWFLNVIALVITVFKPAEANMTLYKYLYRNYVGSSTLIIGLNDIPHEHENLQVRFFRDSLWVRQRLDEDSLIKPDTFENVLVIVNQALPYDSSKLAALVSEENRFSPLYRDMPAWLALLEYKDWYRRSDKWHVYLYSPQDE